jgi:hypothetical protein
MDEEIKSTRREILKKAGRTTVFVIPTIISFKISALACTPSNVAASVGNHHETHRNDHEGHGTHGVHKHKF